MPLRISQTVNAHGEDSDATMEFSWSSTDDLPDVDAPNSLLFLHSPHCSNCQDLCKRIIYCKDAKKQSTLAAEYHLHTEEVLEQREIYREQREIHKLAYENAQYGNLPEHLKLQMDNAQQHNKRKHYAAFYEDLTIDGADQSAFLLPIWAESDTFESSAFKVKAHVVNQ